MTGRRVDAGAAVGGLFAKTTATGGLAGQPQERAPSAQEGNVIVRQGVELTEGETSFLRSLSRPARTGQPRTLGSKFVATGVLAAAIELLRDGAIEMDGVAAGDLAENEGAGSHGADPRRGGGRGDDLMTGRGGWALRISLRTGVRSARPLTPALARVSVASWLRPRPPYVTAIGGLAGSDPVLGWWRDQGSAGGRDKPERGREPNQTTSTTRRAKTTDQQHDDGDTESAKERR